MKSLASAQTSNVAFGSKAVFLRHSHLCPLLGGKRTLDVRFKGSMQLVPGTSEGGGKADILLSPLLHPPQGLTDEPLWLLASLGPEMLVARLGASESRSRGAGKEECLLYPHLSAGF